MAEHNAIKYAASQITRATKRAFGLDEHEDSVTRLSESVQLSADWFDLNDRPDWAWLRGELLWSASLTQGAIAAEFSQVGISNPAGSGKLIIIDKWNAIAQQLNPGETRLGGNAAFTGTGTPTQRDGRIQGIATPIGVIAVSFTNHAAARLGTLLEQIATNAADFEHTAQVVLPPGFFWSVGPIVVNTAVNVSVRGRERPALPGELSQTAGG